MFFPWMESMTPANLGLTAIACGVLIGISGCGSSDTDAPSMSEDDTLLHELLGTSAPESLKPESLEPETLEPTATNLSLAHPAPLPSGLEIPRSADAASHVADHTVGHQTSDSHLSIGTGLNPSGLNPTHLHSSKPIVRFQVGDQFPFTKTIRQNVVQATTDLNTQTTDQLTAETSLQLALSLSVLSASHHGYTLQVMYHRVQYSQDMNGQKQTFDSATPSSNGTANHQVPPGIEPYVGMVGGGFRFVLTSQNQITAIDGLDAFLDQCVSATPFEQRVNLRAALQQKFQTAAIAELIDESIGLLPYGSTSSKAGDVWVTDRYLQQESPIRMQNTYRLLAMSGEAAEVGFTGRIESAADANMMISAGRTAGTCLVNFATGLPMRSKRMSYLKIVSQPTPRQTVEVIKQIESTFTSQKPSYNLMVQRHRSTPVVRMGEPTFQPVQSAMMSDNPAHQPTQSHGGSPVNSNQPLHIHPVSSGNPVSSSGGGAVSESSSRSTPRLTIPSGPSGGISPGHLRSSPEDVYPD